jgi:hypothetical protein
MQILTCHFLENKLILISGIYIQLFQCFSNLFANAILMSGGGVKYASLYEDSCFPPLACGGGGGETVGGGTKW